MRCVGEDLQGGVCVEREELRADFAGVREELALQGCVCVD